MDVGLLSHHRRETDRGILGDHPGRVLHHEPVVVGECQPDQWCHRQERSSARALDHRSQPWCEQGKSARQPIRKRPRTAPWEKAPCASHPDREHGERGDGRRWIPSQVKKRTDECHVGDGRQRKPPLG